MRAHVFSDIHLEFAGNPNCWGNENVLWDDPVQVLECLYDGFEGADIAILAGDITNIVSPHLFEVFKYICSKYLEVIYVPGNHEFWGTSLSYGLGKLDELELAIKNLHILNNQALLLDDHYEFFGGTLWYDDYTYAEAKAFADFHYVSHCGMSFSKQNREFRAKAAKHVNSETVVISHHMPSPRSVSPRFVGDKFNQFFVSDCTQLIREKQPKLWIHGHTHDVQDYQIGATRVYCHPMDYMPNWNANIRAKFQKVIEI